MKNFAVIMTITTSLFVAAFQIYVVGWWVFPLTACLLLTTWFTNDLSLYSTKHGQYISIAWYLVFAIPVSGVILAVSAAAAGFVHLLLHRYMYRKAGLEAYLTY